jgi:hypothetical protein
LVVVQRALDGSRDVRAAAASSDPSVELTHEIIGKRNVHTHGHTLAHTLRRGLFEDLLPRARAGPNERVQALTLGKLAMIAADEGRVEDAVAILEGSLRIDRDLGDSPAHSIDCPFTPARSPLREK